MGKRENIECTVVRKYPSGRDDVLKTGSRWLNGKRKDDGAEGLWRVEDKLYDLEEWARNHPGGEEWITLTKGTDITEAFESHHINLTAERLLPTFYVRDAVGPRAYPFTFRPDGFYRKFKARVREALKDVDFHGPSTTSKLIADSLLLTTIALCVTAVVTQSWIAIVLGAIFLTWTGFMGHIFIHQRDSFRMYYFDLTFMSSKEWRITHVLSHHLYTNTLLDMQISLLEPFISWIPWPDKPLVQRSLAWIYSPLLYFFVLYEQTLKRVYSIFWEFNGPEFRDLVPLLLLSSMLLAASPGVVLLTTLKLMAVGSFHFMMITLNAGHHHSDIFHEGDVHREDFDWGLAQLDSVRGRGQNSMFFDIITFGMHDFHHLLPTIDLTYLYLCKSALDETCREFDVDAEAWSPWELVKGQYSQLGRSQPTTTPNQRGKYVS